MKNLSSLSKIKALVSISLFFIAVSLFLQIESSNGILTINSFISSIGIFCLFLVFQYTRKAKKEISRVIQTCNALGKGNFEHRIKNIEEKGDIAELQWSVNEMTDAMDSFVREATAVMDCVSQNRYFRRILEHGMHGDIQNGSRIINRATNNVEEKVENFGLISDDLDHSLSEVSQQISNMIVSLEKTSRVMKESVQKTRKDAENVVKISDETSVNVQTISSAAEEMSAAVAEITEQMSRTSDIVRVAVTNSETAQGKITYLSESVDKIESILGLINDIAKQTHLLALNATIEASRAGEAGKGFSVVASEVKGLAGQTTIATQEIEELVKEIQSATKDTVDIFTNIKKEIMNISESSSIVAASIEEQSAASKEIAQSAEKASNATNGVVRNISAIKTSIDEVDSVTGEVYDIADQLSNQVSKKLDTLLKKMEKFMLELKKIS